MVEYATKTSLPFFPMAQTLAVDSVGDKLTSGAVKMGDLARLTYVKCRARGALAFSAAATCEVTVSVLLNGVERAAETVTVTAASVAAFDFPVTLSDATGDDNITLKWAVDSAAAASVTGALSGALDVEHPLVIGA